ncbi:calumenin-B-like isoform X2 [Vanacampus margaritifer]
MELWPFLMCFALSVVYATIKPTEKGPFHHQPVSEWEHNDIEEQERFLGQDQAKTFEQRLGMLVEIIDEDKDSFVTMDEMMKWLRHVHKGWIYKNIDGQWMTFDFDGDGEVSWEEYKNATYGRFFDDPDVGYKQMMARDDRRFKIADLDGDLKVNKSEFASFVYPEHFEHMEEIVMIETLDDLDGNGDGVIDLGEYIGEKYAEEDIREPELAQMDRDHFTKFLDKNTDGKLQREEIRDWLLLDENRHADAEVKLLFQKADADKDGRLTKAEILDKYDLFVGSKVSEFGKVITRHDEF